MTEISFFVVNASLNTCKQSVFRCAVRDILPSMVLLGDVLVGMGSDLR